MCEHFLRASLTSGNWVDRLPWVLLGLRSAVKKDIRVSPAKLVLGQPLCVPGEFLPEGPPPHVLMSQCRVSAPLEAPFRSLALCTTACQTFFFCGCWNLLFFVFVLHDAHHPLLRPLYDSLFRVIEPGSKLFLLDFLGRQEVVSVDRLKPAHIL